MSNFPRTFEEVYETLPGTGWLTKEEARILWDCCERTRGPILEVGCYEGRSTVLLASHRRKEYLYANDCGLSPQRADYQILVVDPFKGFSDTDPLGVHTETRLWSNLGERSLDNVMVYRTKIEDWEPREVSFAYLDGNHTYQGTKDQIVRAIQCNPVIIAIHDVNDTGDGVEVKRAAVEMLGVWDYRVERLAVWFKPTGENW